MKKTKLLFVVGLAFVGAISFLGGCATTSKIPPELIVQRDPANPLQGTWIERTTELYLQVIEGYNGTWYQFSKREGFSGGWIIIDKYTIEKIGNEFVVNSMNANMNTAKIRFDNNILYVGNNTYRQFNN
jgi:hypothetical protein